MRARRQGCRGPIAPASVRCARCGFTVAGAVAARTIAAPMPQNELAHAFDSPIVIGVLALVGIALLAVFVRELVRMPRSLLALTATAFLDMVGLLMVGPRLPFYVKELHDGGDALFGLDLGAATVNSILVAAYTAAQLIASPWWGRFSDHRGRRPALLIALGASVVAYLVFGFAGSL